MFYWYLHGHSLLDYRLYSLCLIEQYYLCHSIFNCIVDVSHGYRYSSFYILYLFKHYLFYTFLFYGFIFSFIIFIFQFFVFAIICTMLTVCPCWDNKSMAISNIPHWQWEISFLLSILYSVNKILQMPANAVIILLVFIKSCFIVLVNANSSL